MGPGQGQNYLPGFVTPSKGLWSLALSNSLFLMDQKPTTTYRRFVISRTVFPKLLRVQLSSKTSNPSEILHRLNPNIYFLFFTHPVLNVWRKQQTVRWCAQQSDPLGYPSPPWNIHTARGRGQEPGKPGKTPLPQMLASSACCSQADAHAALKLGLRDWGGASFCRQLDCLTPVDYNCTLALSASTHVLCTFIYIYFLSPH